MCMKEKVSRSERERERNRFDAANTTTNFKYIMWFLRPRIIIISASLPAPATELRRKKTKGTNYKKKDKKGTKTDNTHNPFISNSNYV